MQSMNPYVRMNRQYRAVFSGSEHHGAAPTPVVPSSNKLLRTERHPSSDGMGRLCRLLAGLWVIATTLVVRGFDNDGHTDIIWQNMANREFAVWYLRQTNFITSALIRDEPGGDWRIAATADFNRDGHPDFLWRSPSSGSNEIWLMKEIQVVERHALPPSAPDFIAAGAGDFNADGYPDIFWRDPAMNLNGIWFMEGTRWNGAVGWLSNRSQFNWNVGAIVDFNHDSQADIVWRDRYTGENILWIMNGADLQKSVALRTEPDASFQMVGAAPFNLLGHIDFLFRHTNGQNMVWSMRGTQFAGRTSLPTEFSRDWKIAGTGGFTNPMFLSATADSPLASLTLLWRYGPPRFPTIQRRELGTSSWQVVATNYVPTRLTNSDLTLGRRYEFRVGEEYLLTALAEPPVEDRGKIILVVEQTLIPELEPDLDLLKADLVGDGWSVVRTNVQRHDDRNWSRNIDAIASLKGFITNVYYSDPARTKAVFLIGHVPIPYSGFQNPDGHGGRALPADAFYGDVDGIYTDSAINFSSFLGPFYLTRHDNHLRDGKFDQNRVPNNSRGLAELELAVGRADFALLPSFASLSEPELTRRYIQKTHSYRHKKVTHPQRICVGTFFSGNPNRDTYAQATRLGNRIFGIDPEYVFEGNPFDRTNAALWGVMGGFGLPFGIFANNIWHLSGEMPHVEREPKIAFLNLFGSYFVDFHYPDNFMRAFLATPTYGLATMWFKPVPIDRIGLDFESTGLGDTIGSGFIRSMHSSTQNGSANMFVTLLGDPTLRVHLLAPPSLLKHESGTHVALRWSASPESGVGYYVYRSTNQLEGPWVRLTPQPLVEPNFTDFSTPPGPKVYQVRAAKLTHTGSGSFTNLSQGIFVGVP